MDALTFTAKLVEFLAWPVAAVALVLLLRDEIRNALPFVKKLKAGPVEAEFEREVKELRATAEASPQTLPPLEPLGPEKQVLLQLVQVSPRAAVLEAWRGVEDASLRIVQDRGLYVPEREARSPLAVIRAIHKQSLLTPDEVALYHDLRTLRNQAAHDSEFSPTVDSALNYIELAGRLRRALERAAANG